MDVDCMNPLLLENEHLSLPKSFLSTFALRDPSTTSYLAITLWSLHICTFKDFAGVELSRRPLLGGLAFFTLDNYLEIHL